MALEDINDDEIELWYNTQCRCDIAFDIGIHDICHLNHFRRCGNDVVIYAFEPDKFMFDCVSIESKEWLNFHLFNFGFGDVEQDSKIYRNSMSIFRRDICDNTVSYPIKIVTLDSFCQKNNIAKIDFLKIDTEGYDGRILLGGKDIIQKCKWIQIENFFIMETDNDIKDKVVQLIKDMGVSVYRMLYGTFTKVSIDTLYNFPAYCNYLLTKEDISWAKTLKVEN